jgi:type II secretory pathway pseudopilin PulG
VVISIIVILMGLVVPVLYYLKRQVKETETLSLIQGVSMALDTYRVEHATYPPDLGAGRHADLDKSAECLAYYLSGRSVVYDSKTTPAYPWPHALLDVRRLAPTRRNQPQYYEFDARHLADHDGDGLPEFVDAWRRRFIYNTGGEVNGAFNQFEGPRFRPGLYDLLSAGYDGRFCTDDDLVNRKIPPLRPYSGLGPDD